MPRYTVNCSILLTDLPLLDRPQAAADAGFSAVEFWWPWPDSGTPETSDIEAFVAAVEGAGVELTGLNFFAGDMPAGDRGVLSDPARSQEFRDNVPITLAIGKRLGTTAFNALYGLRPEGVSDEESDTVAVDNLVLAGQAAAAQGAVVLLEPVSGAPTYPLKTAADALAVIERVRERGVDNVRLLADYYHLAVNGDDVQRVIDEHAADFGHVQIADDPGRGEPGTGALPLATWVADAERLGYRGWIGLEYKSDAPDPFAWLPRGERGATRHTDTDPTDIPDTATTKEN